MKREVKIEVRLSDSYAEFLAATLDLLQEVLNADEALVADGILEAADQLLAVVERRRGQL